ncbi:MAG: site-2 protease family protein, partial [Candidatus Sungbacteria bacterium]|nr:site-2 protease family protein [Candidatus Sungbacteria bacterium]
ILGVIFFINLLLAVFNLVPIPPLDGSKVFYAFMPGRTQVRLIFLVRQIHSLFNSYMPLILIAFFFFGPTILKPIFSVINMIVWPMFSLLTGTQLMF